MDLILGANHGDNPEGVDGLPWFLVFGIASP
jgi:hypothetical protein